MKTALPIASGIHLGGHGSYHGYGAPSTLSLPSNAARLYKGGVKGSEVIRLQKILNFLGYKDSNGNVLETETGIFGANTQAAVIKFNNAVRSGNSPLPNEWQVEGWGSAEWMDGYFPPNKNYIDGWGVDAINAALQSKGGGTMADNAIGAVNEILGIGASWGEEPPATTSPVTPETGSSVVSPPSFQWWKWGGLAVLGLSAIVIVVKLAGRKDA